MNRVEKDRQFKTGAAEKAPRKSDDSPATDPRRAIGFKGEQLAVAFMLAKGWRVMARNYQLKIGEIDLVVGRTEEVCGRQEQVVAIVEVKTKSERRGPPPEASVTSTKRRRLVQLAQVFLEKEKIRDVNIRFDVISVDLSDDEPRITHFPCAFDADAQIW